MDPDNDSERIPKNNLSDRIIGTQTEGSVAGAPSLAPLLR